MGLRTQMVLRGVALAHAIAGLMGLAIVVSTPQLVEPSAAAAGAVLGLIVLISAIGVVRPALVARFIYGRPRELAIGMLCAVVAGTTVFSSPPFPLLCWSVVAIATGGAQLPRRGWLAYGLAATLLTLTATTLIGRNGALLADRSAGLILFGVPIALINAAFFGTQLNKVVQRLRRLELTARQEGDRPVRLREALPDLERHRQEALAVIDDAERVAATLPHAPARELLDGVAQSRRAIALTLDDQPTSDSAGLRSMLQLQLSSWSHLWTVREMRYMLEVSEGADRVSVDILRTVQQALAELLDNVDRHGAPGGLVCVSASVVDDFLVLELENAVSSSPRRPQREGHGYGTISVAATLRPMGGTIKLGAQSDQRHRITLRLPLLQADQPEGGGLLDLRSTNHGAVVAQWLSVALRSSRWVTGAMMLASTALDLPDGQGRLGVPVAVIALVVVELLLARAGLRGERSDSTAWVVAASGVAILTSAFLPQADKYQSAGWAAMVLLELAWRGGWRWWISADALRTLAVVPTMYLPAGLEGRAYAAQLTFPWLFGFGAMALHGLMRPIYDLQQQLGTATERFSSLQSFARSFAARHSVIAPLGDSIDRLEGNTSALRARIDDLYERMCASAEDVDRLYPPQVSLRDSIRETLQSVLGVPVTCSGFEAIIVPQRRFSGARLDAAARRAAVLDDLASFAEEHLLNAIEPTAWGQRRLQALRVEAAQQDDGVVVLLVSTIPTAEVSDAPERQQLLRSASGVAVRVSARNWEVVVDLHALA